LEKTTSSGLMMISAGLSFNRQHPVNMVGEKINADAKYDRLIWRPVHAEPRCNQGELLASCTKSMFGFDKEDVAHYSGNRAQ